MIKKIIVLFLVVCTSCQTTKIKNDTYKIATTLPELGAIGQSQKNTKQENNFAVRTLPKLENKIRITVGIVPFNRKLNKVYKSKARYNQNQTKVTYIDSLPKKPELVTPALRSVPYEKLRKISDFALFFAIITCNRIKSL